MRTSSFAIVAALALAAAAPAFAADPAPVAPAPVAATAATDPSQKMICKREKETGSLVKAKKTCHTKAQWDYILDVNSKFANDYVDSLRTRPAGN